MPLNDRISGLLPLEDALRPFFHLQIIIQYMTTLSCYGCCNCGHCCRHCAGASVDSLEYPYAIRHRRNENDRGDGANQKRNTKKSTIHSINLPLSLSRGRIVIFSATLDLMHQTYESQCISSAHLHKYFFQEEAKKNGSNIYRTFQLESERPIKIPSLSECKIMCTKC